MAPRPELVNVALAVWLVFSSLIPPAEAADAGDALAVLLCAVLTGLSLCACLGWYARRRSGQM
ncbi:small integral membrane protein 30 [Kryptolebias marmoratus]|uniref:small integral membrane protein 30 n=1 Tax=Kryptolebias marmoratus TaxID=37003 RepID=UPI000D52FDD3|nr:small integral membrane protein 30 [Kryptolebias marmoratus]